MEISSNKEMFYADELMQPDFVLFELPTPRLMCISFWETALIKRELVLSYFTFCHITNG